MRVLLDTNVLISGLRWPGPSHHLWEAARKGVVRAVTSEALLRELRDVLTRPDGSFRLSVSEFRRIEREVRRHCARVDPKVRLSVLADDADNRVLECAVQAKADLIITGDKELLEARSHQGIRIVTPAAAWKEIGGMPQPLPRGRKR